MSRWHAGGIRRKWLFTRRRFTAARDLLVAADRMRDRWADGDEAVKAELWRALCEHADDFRRAMR